MHPIFLALLSISSMSLTSSLPGLRGAGPAASQGSVGLTLVSETASGELARLSIGEASMMDSVLASKAAFLRFEGTDQLPAILEVEVDMELRTVAGGLIRGLLMGGSEDVLDIRLRCGARLPLSLEEFSDFRLPGRIPEAWAEPIVAAEQGDRLYRRGGSGLDRIDGTVESFVPGEGISMETSLGSKTFPWSEVAALFLEVFEEEAPAQQGHPVVVDLLDGSRLPFELLDLSRAGLDLKTSGGRGLRLPLSSISEVFLPGSGARFLSDIKPLHDLVTSPFGDDLGMSWPTQRDRSASGGSLRAGGKLWTRGLGVHGPSRLEYKLSGAWKRLRGHVAIDDEVIPLQARGSVIFRLHGDGRLLWESEVLHGGDAPVAIPGISLSGIEVLALEVDTADELHLGDRADWLRMVLN